jgi:RecA/RadA recombinase
MAKKEKAAPVKGKKEKSVKEDKPVKNAKVAKLRKSDEEDKPKKKKIGFDVNALIHDTLNTVAKRQGIVASGLDVSPPVSTGLLMVDLCMGGGLRPGMVTAAAEEQCAKTTLGVTALASGVKRDVPFLAMVDYEGCVVSSTLIGYGKGKHARLDSLFDLSKVAEWTPGTWVGQVRRDIDTFETGHEHRGTGVRQGSLYYKGKFPTTKVKFNTGHFLVGHGHKMFVLTNGQVQVKPMEDLVVGEQVLTARNVVPMVEEVWKPVKGFGAIVAKRYEVSNLGRVRSLDHFKDGTVKTKAGIVPRRSLVKGRVLKPQVVKDGHLWVALCDGETQNKQLVHRIVAATFIGKAPKNKPNVLHWNDNPADNRVTNLRYGSDFDNAADRTLRGRATKGQDIHTAKLEPSDIKRIKELRARGWELKRIGDKFGVSDSTVYQICAGNAWTHLSVEAKPFDITEEVAKHYEVSAVVSVEKTGKKEHVFDISLSGVGGDELPHSIITNGVVTHNSTKAAKRYVHEIFKGQGVKLKMHEIFGKEGKEGGWEIQPRVNYINMAILEHFYEWLAAILRELPDKRFLMNKWWYVFEDTKKNKARVGDEVDSKMTKTYGGGLWVEAPDGSPQGIVLLDSYTAMNPAAKDEEDISNQLSVKASAFSKQLERVKGRMLQKMVVVYGLNHLRDNPMAMFGPKVSEKGGKALQQFSDVRLRQTSRSLSAAPFKVQETCKTTFNELEKSVEVKGKDSYRYVHIKAIKNKHWVPNRECFFRIWVEDASGVARGLDPFFDVACYLKETGQMSGQKKALKLNLDGLGQAKKPVEWLTLKRWVLGTKEEMTEISKSLGYKPMSLKAFCFRQMEKGRGEELYVEYQTNKASTKGDDDDSDDGDDE